MRRMVESCDFSRSAYLERPAIAAAGQILQWGDPTRLRILFLNAIFRDQLCSLEVYQLAMVDWALHERIYTPREIRNGLQLKPAWMQVLQLAFQEGLQDTAIAKRMNVSERTVQYYWTKIRDVLEVYPDNDKNLRIQTELRAREEGLID